MTLEAKNLSFTYPCGRSVLQNLSLRVEGGEWVGVFAPSGRGKTTLCKLLAGYEKPQSGQVLLDGKPLASYRGYCHEPKTVEAKMELVPRPEPAGMAESNVISIPVPKASSCFSSEG